MIRLGKYLLAFYTAVLVAWIVPWAYRFLTTRAGKAPFVLYSPVIHDFALLDHADGERVRRDLQGRTYTEQEFDSILPLFYYRQLMADGRLPAELQGVPLTPKLIQTESFNFRHVPADRNKPLVGLYPLLESRSGRVDLEMPGDVFRITGERIEFIDMASNTVNEEKSRLFTRALLRKGFAFTVTGSNAVGAGSNHTSSVRSAAVFTKNSPVTNVLYPTLLTSRRTYPGFTPSNR